MAQEQNSKPRKNRFVDRVKHGRVLEIGFFRRHWLVVLGVVVMLMVYMTNRYTCQTQMEKIRSLEQQLEVVKTERIRAKSAYMSNIRESQMQHRIDSLHMQITVADRPPYHLSRN